MDRNDRAHSEVRSRSNSTLQEPSSFEKARTQSPTPRESTAASDVSARESRRKAAEEITVK
ncbi:unnamed protein product [Strongylus vulgaris]|uniref:Uncharacterized protein n=1 Tax=Strongylus vulgaris TaxID=40348 RepID=A0A3P7JDF7_STRVU|nr:unnamed protein product [Strongylus vulgaris]